MVVPALDTSPEFTPFPWVIDSTSKTISLVLSPCGDGTPLGGGAGSSRGARGLPSRPSCRRSRPVANVGSGVLAWKC